MLTMLSFPRCIEACRDGMGSDSGDIQSMKFEISDKYLKMRYSVGKS